MASVKVFLFSAFNCEPLFKDDTHSIRERKTKTVQPDMNTSIAWEDRCITHIFWQVVPESGARDTAAFEKYILIPNRNNFCVDGSISFSSARKAFDCPGAPEGT